MLGRAFVLLAAAALSPPGAGAQTAVAFEVGASQIAPPLGFDSESARFGIAGMRVSHFAPGGSGFDASLMFGQAFGDSTGGDFVSGGLAAMLRTGWGTRWTAGIDAELVGFEIRSPFPHRALAVEGGPALSFHTGPLTATARGVFGVGRSRVEVWRRFRDVRRVFANDLWRAGGSAELMLGSGPLSLGVSGGLHDSPVGTYGSGGARVVVAGGWGAVELRGDVWETPLSDETELTGGLAFVIPLSSWSVRGFLGRSEPDPLTLALPGSMSGGVLLAVNLYDEPAAPPEVAVPYETVSETATGARVRIRVEPPESAERVEVLGDFTLWSPVPMRRDGDGWTVEVDVPYGVHHYGFLVNDQWYVPEDVADVVPDEWGRVSAILVLEGAN